MSQISSPKPAPMPWAISFVWGFVGIERPSFTPHLYLVDWLKDHRFWKRAVWPVAFAREYEGEERTSMSMPYAEELESCVKQ